MVMVVDTPYLPEDIIPNILKRLPVKSLIRFQCVCKYWKNLIKIPSFIADHLQHSRNQNPSLLFQRHGRGGPLELCMLDCEMQVHEVPNAPLIGSSLGVSIIGSSNGLLCIEFNDKNVISHSPRSLLLWNPAIREMRPLPRTNFYFNPIVNDCSLGFGFSPIVNDYKIVRAFADIGRVVNRVQVYSLSTGTWKEIEFGNLEGVCLYLETVTINGTMFWDGLKLGDEEEDENDINLIVSFDMALEVFTLIPRPALDSNLSSKLTMYENKLAIISHSRIGNFEYSLIDLWVMEEGISAFGERWSWTKKYTSSLYPCFLYPGTIWRNEIVCNVHGMSGNEREVEDDGPKDGLILFNLTANELRMFSTYRCGRSHHIFNYVESLVPVENIHIEEP